MRLLRYRRMATVSLKLLGTGDAFHSGGRLHTAFSLRAGGYHALIDCGATTLAYMRHLDIDVAAIDAILLSHLHGDHFGGVPYILMDACYNAPRQKPLVLAGPAGTRLRVTDTLGCLYPGAPSKVDERVPLQHVEYHDRQSVRIGPLDVLPIPVVHPSGATSYGLRIAINGRIVAFSGDTEWAPALAEVASGADLFICECYAFDKAVPFHVRYTQLRDAAGTLGARRVILTHLGREALLRVSEMTIEVAEDGQEIEF
jgi:ribonuclease BN (tRNA processing enzyme)